MYNVVHTTCGRIGSLAPGGRDRRSSTSKVQPTPDGVSMRELHPIANNPGFNNNNNNQQSHFARYWPARAISGTRRSPSRAGPLTLPRRKLALIGLEESLGSLENGRLWSWRSIYKAVGIHCSPPAPWWDGVLGARTCPAGKL